MQDHMQMQDQFQVYVLEGRHFLETQVIIHSIQKSIFISKSPLTPQKKQITKLCTKLHVFDL